VETAGDEHIVKERPGLGRRVLRLAALASTIVFALALVGYVVRDRARWLALLMYLPMMIVALVTIFTQLAALERGRWKRRLIVTIAAGIAGAFALRDMYGSESIPSQVASGPRILQWNVQWGRDATGWTETVGQIEGMEPDIIVLSEAPPDEKLEALRARLGGEWAFTVSRNKRVARYWYAIAVMSRWPMSEAHDVPLPNGAAHAVTIATPHWPTRVLAVDGMSDPKILRRAFLESVAQHGGDADIIAGDFNAVARSVGFDAIRSQGFALASRAGSGWRGTYPAKLPLYDVDHVWLGRRYIPVACDMLDSPGTNHRGQLVLVKPAN
jgi:endonuclease/exonuclease/phosphatase family metal-dependent hydrolase